MIKKLTAFLFCILLLAALCVPVYAAEDSFVLVAVNANSVIIEPTYIPYTSGQTVREALMDTDYEFLGIEQGFIYEIEGIDAAFHSFCNIEDVQSPLEADAKDVSVVCYHVASEYSAELCELIIRMAEFNEMGNAVNYPASAAAYDDALTAVRTGNGAKEALDALNAAIEEYEEIFGGEKYTVTVNALKGSESLTAVEVTFTDSYGNKTTANGTSIDVIAGKYSFVVCDGGYNRTEGTISVQGDMLLTVSLPSTEWFGEVKLLDSNKAPYKYTQNSTDHTATYYVHDMAKQLNSIYLNVLPGDGVDTSKTKLRTIYTGINGGDYSVGTRSWDSVDTALTYLVEQNTQGKVFDLNAEYVDDDGYTQIQSYEMNIVRIPTLREVTVNAEGTVLPMNFDPTVTEYSFVTVSDNVDVTAEAFGDDYSVTGQGNIKIGSGSSVHKITVKSGSLENTYTLSFTKVGSVPVRITAAEGVDVNVFNAAGSNIAPVDGVYNLIAGEKYTLRSGIDTYYFAEMTFTASADLSINAPTPDTGAWLEDIAVYNGNNTKIRLEYPSDKDFSADVHRYTFTASDCNTTAYIQATSGSGYTATAMYNTQTSTTETHGVAKSVNITKAVNASGTANILTQVIAKSGYSNEVTLRVSKEDAGVTYYQDYIITLARDLHISSLTVNVNRDEQALLDKDGKTVSFDRDNKNYKIKVNRDEEVLTLLGGLPNELDATSCCGGYSVVIGGETYERIDNIDVALDPAKDLEMIAISVRHRDEFAVPATYYLTVEKTDPAYITFDTDPEDAVIYLENTVNGKRVLGKNNTFALTPGVEYSYTVSSFGYIGKQGTYTAPAENGTFEISLQEAPENTELEQLASQWPHLRFNSSNNGVIDIATPIKDSDSVLYWATKIGDGYDKDACGCPILVDGYLYTYSGRVLYKVDTTSGEIVATGKMDKPSSFAINPPTYANGMIFVGLADGTVQAFNAANLESLWIYRDELGGQPNCSIIYHNGFVYTGFWVGETSQANYVCINATDEDPTQEKEEKVAVWHHTSKGGFYWAGAYVCDDYLLIGTDDGDSGYTRGYASLLCFDTRTGEVLDEVKMPVVGDIRSSIVEYEGKFYFTNKGGYFFEVTVSSDGTIENIRTLKLSNGSDNDSTPAMSTCTPTIYNGRAYIGVSGASQFGAYSGHNITVIDVVNWEFAYSVQTQGYPQTSGVLTTYYEDIDGCVYVYFFDNYTPGKLRVLKDKPGQTKASLTSVETYVQKGIEKTATTAYNLFTPVGNQAQYAICSPIVDESGTIYFKNDSAYLMAVGSTVDRLEITQNPDKMTYKLGETFDAAGMKVTAHYKNGISKDVTDYVIYSEDPLTENDTDFVIILPYAMYQNSNGQSGVKCIEPLAALRITVEVPAEEVLSGDVNADGSINMIDVSLTLQYVNGSELETSQVKACDVDGDGNVNMQDVSYILQYVNGVIAEFPVKNKQ